MAKIGGKGACYLYQVLYIGTIIIVIFSFHYSPDNKALRSREELLRHLTLPGTCKCGLRCPFMLDETFNFDPNVLGLPDNIPFTSHSLCSVKPHLTLHKVKRRPPSNKIQQSKPKPLTSRAQSSSNKRTPIIVPPLPLPLPPLTPPRSSNRIIKASEPKPASPLNTQSLTKPVGSFVQTSMSYPVLNLQALVNHITTVAQTKNNASTSTTISLPWLMNAIQTQGSLSSSSSTPPNSFSQIFLVSSSTPTVPLITSSPSSVSSLSKSKFLHKKRVVRDLEEFSSSITSVENVEGMTGSTSCSEDQNSQSLLSSLSSPSAEMSNEESKLTDNESINVNSNNREDTAENKTSTEDTNKGITSKSDGTERVTSQENTHITDSSKEEMAEGASSAEKMAEGVSNKEVVAEGATNTTDSATSKEVTRMTDAATSNEDMAKSDGAMAKGVTSNEDVAASNKDTSKEDIADGVTSKENIADRSKEDMTCTEEMAKGATSNEDMTEGATNKEDMDESATSKEDMVESATNKKDMDESATSKEDMTEGTTNKEDMVESATSNEDMVESATSKEDMAEGATSKEDMAKGAISKEDMVKSATTTSKEDMVEIATTTSKEDMVESATSKEDMVESATRNEDIAKDATSKEDMVESATSKEDMAEDAINKEDMVDSAISKEDMVESATSKEDITSNENERSACISDSIPDITDNEATSMTDSIIAEKGQCTEQEGTTEGKGNVLVEKEEHMVNELLRSQENTNNNTASYDRGYTPVQLSSSKSVTQTVEDYYNAAIKSNSEEPAELHCESVEEPAKLQDEVSYTEPVNEELNQESTEPLEHVDNTIEQSEISKKAESSEPVMEVDESVEDKQEGGDNLKEEHQGSGSTLDLSTVKEGVDESSQVVEESKPMGEASIVHITTEEELEKRKEAEVLHVPECVNKTHSQQCESVEQEDEHNNRTMLKDNSSYPHLAKGATDDKEDITTREPVQGTEPVNDDQPIVDEQTNRKKRKRKRGNKKYSKAKKSKRTRPVSEKNQADQSMSPVDYGTDDTNQDSDASSVTQGDDSEDDYYPEHAIDNESRENYHLRSSTPSSVVDSIVTTSKEEEKTSNKKLGRTSSLSDVTAGSSKEESEGKNKARSASVSLSVTHDDDISTNESKAGRKRKTSSDAVQSATKTKTKRRKKSKYPPSIGVRRRKKTKSGTDSKESRDEWKDETISGIGGSPDSVFSSIQSPPDIPFLGVHSSIGDKTDTPHRSNDYTIPRKRMRDSTSEDACILEEEATGIVTHDTNSDTESLIVSISRKDLPVVTRYHTLVCHPHGIGDIVWARAHMLPFWPGKIISHKDWKKNKLQPAPKGQV